MIMVRGLIAHDNCKSFLDADGRVKERQVSQKELEQLRGMPLYAISVYQHREHLSVIWWNR